MNSGSPLVRAGSRRTPSPCRARGEQDQAGDVAVELSAGSHGANRLRTNSQPRKAIERASPASSRTASRRCPSPVLPRFMQRAEIDLDQHRDDHHPDEQADRQIDLRHLHAADGLEDAGQAGRARCRATMQRNTQTVRKRSRRRSSGQRCSSSRHASRSCRHLVDLHGGSLHSSADIVSSGSASSARIRRSAVARRRARRPRVVPTGLDMRGVGNAPVRGGRMAQARPGRPRRPRWRKP